MESKPTATHLVGRPGDDYVIPTDEWIKILFVEIDLPVAFRRDRENSDRFIGYIRGRATGYLAVEDFVPDDALVYESWMPACFDNEDGVSGHIISKYEVKGAPNVLHISRRYECARKSADDIQEKLDVTAWRIYGKWLVFRGYDPFATFDLEHQIIKAFRDS